MNSGFLASLFILILLMLLGCGNKDVLFEQETEEGILRGRPLMVERSNRSLQSEFLVPAKRDTFLTREEIEFRSGYLIDGQMLDPELEDFYIRTNFWIFDADTQFTDFRRLAYEEPGLKQVIFCFVDIHQDTLADTLSLWIHEPLADSIVSPAPGEHNINVYDSPVLFSWVLKGAEAGENIRTQLYLSTNLETLFNTPVAEVSNQNQLFLNIKPKDYMPSPVDSVSYRFYWSVVHTNIADSTGKGMRDTSRIEVFYSAPERITPGTISGAIFLLGRPGAANLAELLLTGPVTRTLIPGASGSFQFDNLLPGAYLLHIDVPDYPEYLPDTLPLHLYAGEDLQLDSTIFIEDPYPPQAGLVQDTLRSPADLPLRLNLADQGSGIKPNALKVWLDCNTPTDIIYDSGLLTLSTWSPDSGSHDFCLIAQDNAGNSSDTLRFSVFHTGGW